MKAGELRPVYFENGHLIILDQTKLPNEEIYRSLDDAQAVWDAIRSLALRGAPAIGVGAAYGLYVAVRGSRAASKEEFEEEVHRAAAFLDTARPTAVNLHWALTRAEDRVRMFLSETKSSGDDAVEQAKNVLFDEADAICREDIASCRKMGEYGLRLLKPGMGILTHCNAGALATAQYGTCLSPIYLGEEQGYHFHVFADETRPLLQGARLTSWELSQSGVDVTLICDNMAATVMRKGWIDAVVVGCDRMAANGDGANKIGTSGVAILAKEFGIPFYMYVPTSTIDLSTPSAAEIPIELRDGNEIREMWYREPMAPAGVKTFNPAFDVTPAEYITAVVTERGVVRPPYPENLRKIMQADRT